MPFLTPNQAENNERMYESFKAYIVPQIIYNPVLRRLDATLDEDMKLFNSHFSSDFILSFECANEAHSHQFNRKVFVDFFISYAFRQSPDWMKTQVEFVLDKGLSGINLFYFDEQTHEELLAKRLGPFPTPDAAIEALAQFLQKDLGFGGGDEDGSEQPIPEDPSGIAQPTPEMEPALAWVRQNCRFAVS